MANANLLLIWECKECNAAVKDEDSVAFHLIDGILYGWCRPCFEDSMRKLAQARSGQTQSVA